MLTGKGVEILGDCGPCYDTRHYFVHDSGLVEFIDYLNGRKGGEGTTDQPPGSLYWWGGALPEGWPEPIWRGEITAHTSKGGVIPLKPKPVVFQREVKRSS